MESESRVFDLESVVHVLSIKFRVLPERRKPLVVHKGSRIEWQKVLQSFMPQDALLVDLPQYWTLLTV